MATDATLSVDMEKLVDYFSPNFLNALDPARAESDNIEDQKDPKILLQNGKQHLDEAAKLLKHPDNRLSPAEREIFEQTQKRLLNRQLALEKRVKRIRNPFLRLLPSKERLVPLLRNFMDEARDLRSGVSEKSRAVFLEKRAKDMQMLAEFCNDHLVSQSSPRSSLSVNYSVNDSVEDLIQRIMDDDEEAWKNGREKARKEGLELCTYCGAKRFPCDTTLVRWRNKLPSPELVCRDFCMLVIGLPKLLSTEDADGIRKTLLDDDLFKIIQRAIIDFHYNEKDPPPKLLVNLMSYRDKISNIVDTLTTLIMHPTIFSEDSYRSIRSSLRRLLSKCIKMYYKKTGEYIYPQRYVFDTIRWSIAKHLPEAGDGSHGTVYVVDYVDNPLWKRKIAVKVPKMRVKDKRMVYEFLIQWNSGGNLHESASRQSLLMPLKINGNTRDYIARRTQAGDFQHHNERSILQTRIHNWVVGIVKGLAYLHSENIVHGDLRGYNIIVDDDQETTLLTDFGLSVFADGMSGNHGSTRSGNYLWQPLEILAGENKVRPKKSTDIYFLGGVLIELYTGYDPYYLGPGDPDDEERIEYPTLPTVLEGLTRDPPKHPDRPRFHSNETIDLMQDELWNLTLECWKRDRHQRPTVEQLLERIPRIIQHIGS